MKILFVYPNRNRQIGFNCGAAFLRAALRRDGRRTHHAIRYDDFMSVDSSWSD